MEKKKIWSLQQSAISKKCTGLCCKWLQHIWGHRLALVSHTPFFSIFNQWNVNVIYYCFTVSLQEKEGEKERVQASWTEENFIFLCLEQKNRHKTNSPYLAALNVVCYWSNGELRSLAKNCSLLSGLFNECYLRQISYRVYYIWIRLFDFFHDSW